MAKPINRVPVHRQAIAQVDRGILLVPGGRRRYKDVRINDLSPLYPESMLRAEMVKACKQFASDMVKRGFDPLTQEADFRISGPFFLRDYKQPRGYAHVRTLGQDGLSRFGIHDPSKMMVEYVAFAIDADFLQRNAPVVDLGPRVTVEGK